jgi:hypothetical protein
VLGIIGEGAIGQSVAEIGKAFGMRPLFAAHKGRTGLGPLYTPFDEVIETADVITLHCPLLPETKDAIAMPELRRMKRSAILVNTARGGLVNEADLAVALRTGLIAGAGFDVVTPREPPTDDNPLLSLLDRPNLVLTPHVAWASREAQQALADQLIDNIEKFAAGQLVNVVGGAFKAAHRRCRGHEGSGCVLMAKLFTGQVAELDQQPGASGARMRLGRREGGEGETVGMTDHRPACIAAVRHRTVESFVGEGSLERGRR